MIRFTKAKGTPKPPPKPTGVKKDVLDKLNAFLTLAEPEAVELVTSYLQGQTNAVTYKELREAFLSGGLTRDQFMKWELEYSKMVNDVLYPQWRAAAAAGAQLVMDQYPYFVYEPSVSAAMDFIADHGAELVTNLANEQRAAVNAVVAHVSGYTAVTPDEAARIIRPCVGLTTGQALANVRYRDKVQAEFLKANPKCRVTTAAKKAAEAAARYAARQHRYRGQNIARTELAFAYNAGHYGATKDAQAQGYIGDCVKIWVTAFDERVCPKCAEMDDQRRRMDEPFSTGKLLPPGHPSCRCAVAYEEIPNTNLNPAAQGGTIDETSGTIRNAAGKTVRLVDQSEVKLTGTPDSITQTTSKNGGVTRNYYGPDGKQTKQISNNNHGNPKHHPFGLHGEHAHDYTWDENGTPQHGRARELTDEERSENSDILQEKSEPNIHNDTRTN